MASNMMKFDPSSDPAQFDPFRNMDDFFREFSLLPSLRSMKAEPRMRTDVSETDQAYTVKAEIPGVKKEDIKISVEGNRIAINAEVKEETDDKTTGMVRSERYYGKQFRSLTLPQDVDETKAEARYENGLLLLTLPKKAGGSVKHLTVK